jgi:hypothetical protein
MTTDKTFSLVKVADTEYNQQLSDSHILYQDLAGHFDLYLQETSLWSASLQRTTDAKYIVPYSDLLGDNGQVVEQAEENWFTPPTI